jgi:condensin-2 complex subunit D3
LKLSQANRKLIGTLQKKHIVEHILPIVAGLKRALEKIRSPLLRYLMEYLKELMHDYKNEIHDMLQNDRQVCSDGLFFII